MSEIEKRVEYYPNGQKLVEGTYKDGEVIKETRWDKDGNKK
jgi:antitoxin component YwqK of YwqJK toxin-antitoxin module